MRNSAMLPAAAVLMSPVFAYLALAALFMPALIVRKTAKKIGA